MQRVLQDSTKKNDNWNIRRLVDKSFVPSAQRTSISYCRLMDFKQSLLFTLFLIHTGLAHSGISLCKLFGFPIGKTIGVIIFLVDFSGQSNDQTIVFKKKTFL